MMVAALAVLASAGCSKKDEAHTCDHDALESLAATLAEEPQTLEEESVGRRSVVHRIHTACPAAPAWLKSTVQRTVDEGNAAPEDQQHAPPFDLEAFNATTADLAKMRALACPNYAALISRLDATPFEQREAMIWDGCQLDRFDLYVRSDKPDQKSPHGIIDFSLFKFLTDDGVSRSTARTLARALGHTASLEPSAAEN